MTSLLAPLGVPPDRASQQETIIGNKSPIITAVEVESPPSSGDKSGSSSDWLVVSPYTERQHQLDLQTVDTPFRLLALALVKLDSATPDYATATYDNAFKWSDLFTELKTLAKQHGYRWTRQDFYVVEFRSKLKPNIDRPLLFALDKQSHIEATASGGLLKYWFGEPDSERRNLATCKSFLHPRSCIC